MSEAAEVIATLHHEANDALSRGDLERVMRVYADDVVSMPANQPALLGKGAVRSMWDSLLRSSRHPSS